jgi:hypothetical protein
MRTNGSDADLSERCGRRIMQGACLHRGLTSVCTADAQVFLQNIVPLALQLMLVVEEIELAEWNSTTEDDDDDTDLTSRA